MYKYPIICTLKGYKRVENILKAMSKIAFGKKYPCRRYSCSMYLRLDDEEVHLVIEEYVWVWSRKRLMKRCEYPIKDLHGVNGERSVADCELGFSMHVDSIKDRIKEGFYYEYTNKCASKSSK